MVLHEYSTKKISKSLVRDVRNALKSIDSHGSVEIFVQNSIVTQITVRNIKKTATNGISANNNEVSIRI